jgi:hypothetical protein
MSHRVHWVPTAVLACLILGPVPAVATDLPWTYLEGGYVAVDADASGRVENPKHDLTGEVSTGDESGFYLGAAWAVAKRWHVFAYYEEASQDVELKGTIPAGEITNDGDIDLVLLRVGVGYTLPMSETWDVYGRVSFDYAEADSLGFSRRPALGPTDLGVPGFPGNDTDDQGVGAELGLRIDLTSRLDAAAWLRYTSVGELGFERDFSAEFDDDILGGVELHWTIGNQFGIEAGYEYGEISTFNLGARFIL